MVTVRGVAWRICWPRRKSSKKLPGLVLVTGDWLNVAAPCSDPARRGHSHKTVSRTPASDNGKLMRTCLTPVLADGAPSSFLRRTPDEKEISAFGADCSRFAHGSAGAGGFRRRHEEGHHVQGQHVEGLDEKGRRHVERQHVEG